jgi:hypothetical protein
MMRNSYTATCAKCGWSVPPNGGILKRRHGTRNGFDVMHDKCAVRPAPDPAMLAAAWDIQGRTQPGDFLY